MLRRFWVNFCLVLLFACVQMGVVTHEISHVAHPQKHSQTDKNTGSEQCEQCIAAYAQGAHGVLSHDFQIIPLATQHALSTEHVAHLASVLSSPYSARAPPVTSTI
jgi:hypothetical protein